MGDRIEISSQLKNLYDVAKLAKSSCDQVEYELEVAESNYMVALAALALAKDNLENCRKFTEIQYDNLINHQEEK